MNSSILLAPIALLSLFTMLSSAVAQTTTAPTPAQIEAARIARLRLLCVQVSGADLTDLAGQLKFQRCMKDPPQQAMIQNTLGVRAVQGQSVQTAPLVTNPMPTLVTPQGPLVHPGQAAPAQPAVAQSPGDSCMQGYVWREATAQDHVCVTPMMRRLTAQDNSVGPRRTAPGSDGCRQGFVWREAYPGDHVCVTPATRAQAAADNSQAAARRAAH